MDQSQPVLVEQQPVANPTQLMQTSQAAIRAAESANALAAQIASSSSSSTSGPSADDGRTTKELSKEV